MAAKNGVCVGLRERDVPCAGDRNVPAPFLATFKMSLDGYEGRVDIESADRRRFDRRLRKGTNHIAV